MMLRPRQKIFVERSLRALGEHGNTLGVAPTGAGKTIMLSAAVGEHIGSSAVKAAALAHRDELTAQNLAKFRRVNPGITTSVVDAGQKLWAGQVTFAMVPTLTRQANLEAMPALDLLVIDEAHHAVADSYRRIIDRALQRNPDCRIYGVTATPNRGDKVGLRQVFSNVADQIRLGELIASGHLVPPRTFIIDVGVQDELRAVRRSGDDFDTGEVARVMDTVPVTDAVVKHWQEKAGDCQTVAFCSTVAHAEHVAAAFNAAGVPAVLVTGDMPEGERRSVLAAYARGEARIVVNVAVLTEGWDHPPTSCIVLLRPSSFKCTMIQMVGRGLRTVDPTEHPGIIKRDCIVLDFGTSSQLHGCLEQDVDLDSLPGEGEPPTKTCPSCEAEVPIAVMECPICGHAFEPRGREAAPLSDFIMTEIDLLRRSAFQWCDLFGDDAALLANGFNGWAGIFFLNGAWHAVGGAKEERPRLLSIGERLVALAAADDWLNTYETDESAHKSRRWLREPPTDKQLAHLPPEVRADLGMTRYQASALLTFKFNRQAIQHLGGSRLGHACERALQFEFLQAPKDEGAGFDGRILRIFGIGHALEDVAVDWLRGAGFDLYTRRGGGDHGEQFGFSVAGGRIRGHVDGILAGGPAIPGMAFPALWECKTVNAKAWRETSSKGVAVAKPIYAAQIAVYQAYMDAAVPGVADHPALFTAINKDTAELHHELVPFDAALAQRMSDRAVRVLRACDAGDLLPRVATQPDYYECRFCPWSKLCWSLPA